MIETVRDALYTDSSAKLLKDQRPDREHESYVYLDRERHPEILRSNQEVPRGNIEALAGSGRQEREEKYERFLPSEGKRVEIHLVPREDIIDTPVDRRIKEEIYPTTFNSKSGYWVFIQEGNFPFGLPVGKRTDTGAEKTL